MPPPHYDYKVRDAIEEIRAAACVEDEKMGEISQHGAAMMRWAIAVIDRHCQQRKCRYCGRWFPSCGCLSGPFIDAD